MTVTTPALLRCSAVLMISAVLLATTSIAQADQVWVRIHHAASDPQVASMDRGTSLEDYGTFLWGQVSAAEAARMEGQGVRISVSDNPFVMTLGGESFDPVDLVAPMATRQTSDGSGWHLIQFNGPVRPGWVQSLRATGVQVAQPMHPFSYYVWGTGAQVNAARALSSVRWGGPMQPHWAVQPQLRGFDSQPRATMALASAHADQRELWTELSAHGQVHSITPLNRHFNIVHMDAPGDRYSALGEVPGIYTVQYIRPEAGPRGEMSNQSVVGNYDGSGLVFPGYVDWLNDTGYDGAGVTVGVVDGGIRTSHTDLVSRIVPCVASGDSPTSCSTSNNDHGTHVAGAVAGTGATGITDAAGFLRGQGVAPGASVIQQRYPAFLGAGPGSMIPDGMLKIYRESALSGALLTNNSWGPTGTPQGYDIPTQQIDFISRDADPATPGHQPVLAVWSIMNGGGDSNGACAPSSLGSPDEAKNLFAVGSTSLQNTNQTQMANIFRISPNSGHGNACDGRRVPHIVAPGCNTDSTHSASDTAYSTNFCGTSMASPVVSGAVAIWAEKHIAEVGQSPSPALIKAVFTAAAQDLVGNVNADGGTMGHRPDRFQGYGRLDLDLVMNHGLEMFMVDQETVFTAAGQDWSIDLNVVDPNQPVRIMLAWTDAPGHGLGGTTPAWVNDLDLVVEADGQTYLGNVVGGDGWSSTGGSPDDRNNLEGVFLNPAQHGGAINVTVNASDINGDALNPYDPGDPSQDFALVCYNCLFGDPTFSIAVNPSALEACVPDSGSTDIVTSINLGNIGFYSGTLDLETMAEPPGVSSELDPESVVVPGSSVWTLTIDSSASGGQYALIAIGDDGQDIHSSELSLHLDEFLAAGPALSAPADLASDTSLTPNFNWANIADVELYRLQVATDAGFSTVIIDETLTTTAFTPATELATGTEYFWRVAGANLCGDGEWSATYSFTTRLEPIAEFSATSFSFLTTTNTTDTAVLEIGNTGTGNLNWSVETDQIEGLRGSHDPSLDETLDVPNFSVASPANGGSPVVVNLPAGLTTRGEVVGFSFSGDVSGISGNGSWASDMCLRVTAPDGTIFDVGGFSSAIPGCAVNSWDFQGSGSNNDGIYASQHLVAFDPAVEDQGDWTFSFVNGWDSSTAATMNWTDVTITLHKVALPICGEELTNVAWMSVTPPSGVTPAGESDDIVINIDSTGLSNGDYLGYLCIATDDPAASMVPIPVDLTVEGSETPVAEITPASFSFVVTSGQTDTDTLFIGNTGTGTLTWDIDTAVPEATLAGDPAPGACASPEAISWLGIDVTSGAILSGDPADEVTVIVDSTGLAPGNHEALLCVSTNDPDAAEVEVPITLVIEPTDALYFDRFEQVDIDDDFS
jgi:serine protease AprX